MITIRVVNENTRETVQREQFPTRQEAIDFLDDLVSQYLDAGWLGGYLEGTELDAMLIAYTADHAGDDDDDDADIVRAVHVYEER